MGRLMSCRSADLQVRSYHGALRRPSAHYAPVHARRVVEKASSNEKAMMPVATQA
jgi:hypothetical protein